MSSTTPMAKTPTTTFPKKELTIGEYEVHPLPTGQFGLDGGAMFGTVPKVLWEKSNPPVDKNRIPMEARALLLKGRNRNVVIDCGNGGDFVAKYGDKLGPKFEEMYALDAKGPSLEKSLKAAGISFNQVTDVILTHLHFDHAGGATRAEGGKLVPTFPKARYYVQKLNLETASQPNIREKASYFAANFQPLIDAKVLTILEGESQILPGISVHLSHGHTQGHQMVKVTDGKATLLYCGDVVPTSSHVRLAWVMGYDLAPLKLIGEKQKILGPAADEGWYLYFEHDPYCEIASVQRQGSDFAVLERFHLVGPGI